jgi:hypothetical protein
MMKRLRWTVIGAGLGIGAYVYVKRKIREAIPKAGRHLAEDVRDLAGDVKETAGDLGARLREAVAEGRVAMAEREEELRRQLLHN